MTEQEPIELVPSGEGELQLWRVPEPKQRQVIPANPGQAPAAPAVVLTPAPAGTIRSVPDAVPDGLAQDRDPWERQPGESGPAYAAFIVYRDLGPLQRSIKKASETIGKARNNCSRWARAWRWTERAELWDDAQRRFVDTTVMEQREKSIANHNNASRALLGQALRLLQIEQAKPNPDGRTIQQASVAIDRAIHHNRLSLGLPNEIRQQDVELKSQINESLRLQDQVRVIIDEVICPECQAKVGAELRRLATHQRKLAKRVGV